MSGGPGSAPLVVGIGGSTRPASLTEQVVARALGFAAERGARTVMFDGPFLAGLPIYSPGDVRRGDDEREFIAAIRACDGVIVGSPGYHGSLSGLVKNALDLIEDTAGDPEPYLEGRAFGCIVTAAGEQACGMTLVALRSIAHALRAWPTPYGATFSERSPLIAGQGMEEPATLESLRLVARHVVDFARWRAARRAEG
ncbi:MAG: NADPH-dependent FMN reductase [Sphingomonadaceae bacterium]